MITNRCSFNFDLVFMFMVCIGKTIETDLLAIKSYEKCITSTVLLLFYSQALQMACTNSGYVKYLAFQMKVLIRNLLWSNVQWRIMISNLIF